MRAAPIRRSHWPSGVAAVLAAATFLTLPLAVFGVTVLVREGDVRLSALIAHEEITGAARGLAPGEIWDAAVLYVNFARGALNAQIYRLTVGQLVLSTALGLLVGLNLAAARRALAAGACGFGGAGGGAAATLCAATAGAFGCCGGATAGLLATLGVALPLAATLSQAATFIQVSAIGILALNLVLLGQRAGAAAQRLRV